MCRQSRPSSACLGSQSFTSAARCTFWAALSYWVMGPMPHTPCRTACQAWGKLFPTGLTVPMPVISTLRFSIVFSSS